MPNKKTIMALSYVLFVALFASGCGQQTKQFTATPRPTVTMVTPTSVPETDIPTTTMLPAPSETPTSSATPIPAPSPTLASIPTEMPDILIDLGTNDWFWQTCAPEEGNAQIWFSSTPYSDFQPLLAKNGVDYLYPRWSPSGSQFAYVESIPILVPEGTEIPTMVDEGVSLWVQDMSGNRKRISDILPRINFVQADSCGPATEIYSPPIWSPDEKKIVFAYLDLFKAEINYYLIDLNAGTTNLFYRDNRRGTWIAPNTLVLPPLWINSTQLVIPSGETNSLLLFSETGKKTQEFKPPEDLLAIISQPGIYALQMFNHKLLVGFYQKETITTEDKLEAWYLLDVASAAWEKVLDISHMNVGRPYAVDSQSIACETGMLTVFDRQWQVAGQNSELPASPEDCLNGFQVFEYKHQILASYPGSTEQNKKRGIWVAPIQKRAPEPKLIVDLSGLPEPARRIYPYVIDYSWRIPNR